MHWLVPRLSWELLTSIDWIFTCTKKSTLTWRTMEIRTQVSCTYGTKLVLFSSISYIIKPLDQTCLISFCFGAPHFDRLFFLCQYWIGQYETLYLVRWWKWGSLAIRYKVNIWCKNGGRAATMCPTPRHNGSFYNQLGCIAPVQIHIYIST